MFCRNCGKPIADGAKFCPYCGTQQTAPVPAQPTQPPRAARPAPAPQPAPAAVPKPKKKRKRWPIVLVVVLVLLAALAAVGYLVVWPWWKAQKQAEYLAQANEAIDAQDYAAAEEALAQAEDVQSNTKTDLLAAQLAVEQGNYEDAVQKYKAISAQTLQSYTPAEGELEKLESCITDDERTEASDERAQESDVYLAATFEYDENETLEFLTTRRYLGSRLIEKYYFNGNAGVYLDDLYVYETDAQTGNMKEVQSRGYNEDGSINDVLKWTYDEDGKQLYRTKNDVKTREYEYYDNGEVKKQTIYEDDGALYSVDVYDKNGNLTKREEYKDGVLDLSREYSGYDEHGNYTCCVSHDADGNTGKWTYVNTYDKNGRVLVEEHCNANDGVTYKYSYTYDEHGNMIACTYEEPDSAPVIQWQCTYTYDANGHKTAMTQYDEDGKANWEYVWADGLLTKQIQYYGDNQKYETYYYYAPKDQQPGEVGPTTYVGMPNY